MVASSAGCIMKIAQLPLLQECKHPLLVNIRFRCDLLYLAKFLLQDCYCTGEVMQPTDDTVPLPSSPRVRDDPWVHGPSVAGISKSRFNPSQHLTGHYMLVSTLPVGALELMRPGLRAKGCLHVSLVPMPRCWTWRWRCWRCWTMLGV